MNTSPVLPPQSIAAPELVRRLGQILAGLAAVVAARFLRRPHLVGLTVLLWNRLSRAAQRFGREMARPGKPRSPRSCQRVHRARSAAGLPQGRGWLVRELGYEAVAFGCQLEALLAEPAMQAALVAQPAAGRVLRPLCWMLGVPVSALPPVVVQVLGVSVPLALNPTSPTPGFPTPTFPTPTFPTPTFPTPTFPSPAFSTPAFSTPTVPSPTPMIQPTPTPRAWPKPAATGADWVDEKLPDG